MDTVTGIRLGVVQHLGTSTIFGPARAKEESSYRNPERPSLLLLIRWTQFEARGQGSLVFVFCKSQPPGTLSTGRRVENDPEERIENTQYALIYTPTILEHTSLRHMSYWLKIYWLYCFSHSTVSCFVTMNYFLLQFAYPQCSLDIS